MYAVYRNNFRFPFSSLLTLWLSLLHKTRVGLRFPVKITSSCIWIAMPVDWVILHWYAWRTVGQTYGHVITKISRMGTLPDFPRYGARLAWAWSSAIIILIITIIIIIIIIIIHLRCEIFSFFSLILYFLQTILITSLTNGTKTMKENKKKEKAMLRMKQKIKMLS